METADSNNSELRQGLFIQVFCKKLFTKQFSVGQNDLKKSLDCIFSPRTLFLQMMPSCASPDSAQTHDHSLARAFHMENKTLHSCHVLNTWQSFLFSIG